MSRYGIDYYGLALYGPETYVDYTSSMVANPYGYGAIYLSWTSPVGNWSKFSLVRNRYGYPLNPFDGIELLSGFNGNDPTELLDTYELKQGEFYYYSLFIYEISSYSWVRAGDVTGLSVKNFGNGNRLYEYTPDIYKLSTVYSAGVPDENDTLKRFLNLFGFKLDTYQTLTDLTLNRYDVERVSGTLVPLMLKQFGMNYEPEIGLQQSRIILRDAIQLYKEKGSSQGLKEYIKAFSGYSLPSPVDGAALSAVEGVVVGHNLMLDYNDSSFEEGTGHWVASTGTAISRIAKANISYVAISSNVATLTIGSHGYRVGDQVTVSDCLPRFNTTTPVTITAVGATTISYSLTATDLASKRVYSGYISPFPLPWAEPTAPANYPNKTTALMSIAKSTSGSGTVSVKCGPTYPVEEGVPVTAGLAYTFSFYCSADTATRSVTAKINWYDRFGTLLSTSSGSGTTNATGVLSVRPFVSATAPSTAYYAVPEISIASVAGSSAELHYVDACQFEQSASATDFDEARNLHITLKATRINEIVNPHFEAPYAPWSFSGGTAITVPLVPEPDADVWNVIEAELTTNVVTLTTQYIHHLEVGESISVTGIGTPYNGVHTIVSRTNKTLTYAVTNPDIPSATVSGKVFHSSSAVELTSTSAAIVVSSASAPANYMPIYYPGSSYTSSVFFRTYSGSVSGFSSIHWYTSSNTLISTENGATTTASSDWNRMSVTGTAPANAAYAKVSYTLNTVASGDKVVIDEALFERSAFVLDYFDGDAEGENVPIEDVFWEGGVANAGRSHYYKNRVSVIYRLKETLPEYLPAGSTFALYLAQPNT